MLFSILPCDNFVLALARDEFGHFRALLSSVHDCLKGRNNF